MKVKSTISLEFEAPPDADSWDLVRRFTSSTMWSSGAGLKNIKTDIIDVIANGKRVTYKGRG